MSNKRNRALPEYPGPGRKRKTLSLELKYNIIQDFEYGLKVNEIAQKYVLHKSTVATIIKDAPKIMDAVQGGQPMDSSLIRKHHGLIAEMEGQLKTWCDNEIKEKKTQLDQNAVCNHAILIFERLKEEAGESAKNESFVASNGWYSRFKRRTDFENGNDAEGESSQKETGTNNEGAQENAREDTDSKASVKQDETVVEEKPVNSSNCAKDTDQEVETK